jgi:hypothetical protein
MSTISKILPNVFPRVFLATSKTFGFDTNTYHKVPGGINHAWKIIYGAFGYTTYITVTLPARLSIRLRTQILCVEICRNSHLKAFSLVLSGIAVHKVMANGVPDAN